LLLSQTISSTSSSTSVKHQNKHPNYKFVDIGANLLDLRYTDGIYYGKKRHESDFEQVIQRSIEYGVTHLVLTAGTLQESKEAIRVVRKLRQRQQQPPALFLGCTVGIHPTRCQQEFVDNLITNDDDDDDDGSNSSDNKDHNHIQTTTTRTTTTATNVLEELYELAKDGVTDGSVVAIGEIGLDYDRLEFTSKSIQTEFLKRQLQLFSSSFLLGSSNSKNKNNDNDNNDGGSNSNSITEMEAKVASLPLFLHNRSVGRDLLQILQQEQQRRGGGGGSGVVHSFDDTIELAFEFIELGYYIGLNGCSLKTQQNLDTIQKIPLSNILLETDCPYCEIKASHAGYQYIQTSFQSQKKVDKKFELGKLVRGRNEPCQIIQIAEVIAGVKSIPVEDVIHTCYENSMKLYNNFI